MMGYQHYRTLFQAINDKRPDVVKKVAETLPPRDDDGERKDIELGDWATVLARRTHDDEDLIRMAEDVILKLLGVTSEPESREAAAPPAVGDHRAGEAHKGPSSAPIGGGPPPADGAGSP